MAAYNSNSNKCSFYDKWFSTNGNLYNENHILLCMIREITRGMFVLYEKVYKRECYFKSNVSIDGCYFCAKRLNKIKYHN